MTDGLRLAERVLSFLGLLANLVGTVLAVVELLG
jgi:hypothetical protein